MLILQMIYFAFQMMMSEFPNGIIYLEEQFLQACYVFLFVYIKNYGGAILVLLLGIYMALNVVFQRRFLPPHFHRHGFGFIRIILIPITTILLSWVLLIAGFITGIRGNNFMEEAARGTYTHRSRPILGWTVVRTITRVSLHYRFGRWLTMSINRLLMRIPVLATRRRVCMAITIVIMLVIIFWGAWRIPYDLTH